MGVSQQSTTYSTRGPDWGFLSGTSSGTTGGTCSVPSRIDVATCQTRPANVNPHAARATQPNTAGIGSRNGSIDSQSVPTTEGGEQRGGDAHKKVKGRKRHII